MPPLSAAATGGAAACAVVSARAGRGDEGLAAGGVVDSGLSDVAVAGGGAGAAGDGGAGVAAVLLVSPRALSAPSVVERVVESVVESLVAPAAAGVLSPLIDLK
jgi:hypothetical protein